MIQFTLFLDPVAKGRPRFTRKGFAYTDSKTREFEEKVALLSRVHCPPEKLTGALFLGVVFTLKKPKTVKRKYPIVRPDLDNYIKATMDSLSAFWINDSQVIRIRAEKSYGDIPSIEVIIESYETK